eukprot:CAMPEP_0198288802 /NCGR_PEP_ID=MMETSP1449-20131203/7198_1 /TAXON_ID=420275 /ORGANISM="Attheya septentrionalis, Strain CCMP2084" /LENGTH=119 /DNA_ID=CAMNT_0043987017 /DNA_START=163 /DNA_END=522 /DNA_ORIENTATION=-
MANMPRPQSMDAVLFGGHPTGTEGWEAGLASMYIFGGAIIALTLGFAPETEIQTWASNEARARLALKAAGKVDKFEFGTHYNTPEFMLDFTSLKLDDPFDEEEDDDEDEEEDEEEEEDE